MKHIEKKNFIWNFLGLTINSFNSFFFLIIVNRMNGSEEAGIFTYAYSLICLFYIIGIYYTRTYQVSNDSRNFSNKEYIYSRMITCLFMFLVTLLFVTICHYDLFKSMIIILLCLYRLFEAFSDTFLGILQKEGFLYKAGFSLFIKGIIGLISFILVDFITHNLILACLSLVVVNFFFLLVYDIKESKKYILKKYEKKNMILILKNSFPIFIFTFLNIYLVNSAKYTLDFFESSQIQNIFGIILMPGTILSLCSQYILNPYLLTLTDSYLKKDTKTFHQLIKKISFYIILFGIICEIAAYFLGIPVLNIVYNLDLSPYKNHLLLIILGSIFVGLLAILSSALTIMKKNYGQMIIYIINAILSFVLSIVLIKNYSIMGAVLTYTIIMIVQFTLFYLLYKKNLEKRSI